MPIILFLNLKGGVAKTTNAVAVAENLAARGKKILVVDADHQCMASELLLGRDRLLRVDDDKRTLHDLLAAMLSDDFHSDEIARFPHTNASSSRDLREWIDCIPCSHRIDEFSTNMAKARKGHKSNEEFLKLLNRLKTNFNRWFNRYYDFTIVDCPPSLSLQVKFFLGCSEYYIAPSLPDAMSVRGTLYLVERLEKANLKRIRALGTLWSMVRKQVHQHIEIIDACSNGDQKYQGLPTPFITEIPNMAAIADAMDFDSHFERYTHKYRVQAKTIFQSLGDEILQRIEENP